jgi:hypothetical protein
LEKQRKNQEKRKIRQQNKKKKGKKNTDSKKDVKSNLRTDGFETTDAVLRSADNQCPSELPAGHLRYTYTTLISGVMEAFRVYLLRR